MKCINCQSINLEEIKNNVQDPISNEKFKLFKCNYCGLTASEGVANPLDYYYPKDYRKFNFFIFKILSFIYYVVLKNWLWNIKIIGNKILEFGCGNGLLLNHLINLNISEKQVFAIERKSTIELLSHKYKDVIFNSEISNFKNQYFDLIIFHHTLEHLDDPVSILKLVNTLMHDNSVLIISVPNYECIQSKIFKNNWFHLDLPRHRFHFDEKIIVSILEKYYK